MRPSPSTDRISLQNNHIHFSVGREAGYELTKSRLTPNFHPPGNTLMHPYGRVDKRRSGHPQAGMASKPGALGCVVADGIRRPTVGDEKPRPPSAPSRRQLSVHTFWSAFLPLQLWPGDSRFSPTILPVLEHGPDAGSKFPQFPVYTLLPPRTLKSDSFRSSALCARFKRDATVPGEHPRISAIRSYGSPSVYRSTTTIRCSGGSVATIFCTFCSRSARSNSCRILSAGALTISRSPSRKGIRRRPRRW